MTLADLEKFVTGPAMYKGSDGGLHTQTYGQKRKPDTLPEIEEHNSLHLYHLTLSKLLCTPVRRVEPPLQRSVVMRNTLKHLEYKMFSYTPSKRINLDLEEPMALTNLHLSTPADSAITDAQCEKLEARLMETIETFEPEPESVVFAYNNQKVVFPTEPDTCNNLYTDKRQMLEKSDVLSSPAISCQNVDELDSIMQVLVGM